MRYTAGNRVKRVPSFERYIGRSLVNRGSTGSYRRLPAHEPLVSPKAIASAPKPYPPEAAFSEGRPHPVRPRRPSVRRRASRCNQRTTHLQTLQVPDLYRNHKHLQHKPKPPKPEPDRTPDWVAENAPYTSHDRAYHYPDPIQ